ncbi:MAG: discoidin domain-containing protein [Phycisphaerae bacterium]|nr:discoidin domain-containing protein [Phycisphaerae bacterium]
MSRKLMSLVAAGFVLAAVTSAPAGTFTLGSDADTYVASGDTTPHGSATFMYLHDTTNGVGYLRFNVSELNILSVESATLTLVISGDAPRNDSLVTARFFLHGLNAAAGNTPQSWEEATLTSANVGAEWSTNGGEPLVNTTPLDDTTTGAGITETITSTGEDYWIAGSRTITITGEALAQFIEDRAQDDGLVTFLMAFPDSTTGRGFGLASKENSTEAFRPKLEITATTGARTAASNPSPADQATEVPHDADLSWRPGIFASTHNVYLGMSLEDVTAGSESVLVGQGQDANAYDPPGSLAYGQTYYWRIDEVNAAPDHTVFPGEVWSFTVEAYSYPIAAVTATASSVNREDMGPEKTVDASGLNEYEQHSTTSTDMWLSNKKGEQPTWIQFSFDRLYKLDKMLVWNSNQTMESDYGLGAKDVQVEYTADGEAWTALGDFVFAQAPGLTSYASDISVDFAGAAAQAVRLTITSNWGGILPQYGLSEVRFYHVPVLAREPSPTDGATDVDPQGLVLSWKTGREAASHDIYLGADLQAVADGATPVATVDQAAYAPQNLLVDTSYYWRVVEVNQAQVPNAWASDVWTFSTPLYLIVDDFEGYTDDMDAGEAIFQTWIDGYEIDDNGSLVSYNDAPFTEQTIVHGGGQSMPLAYDNTGSVTRSEVKCTFDPPRDWTQHGVTTLVLFFRGQTTNGPAPVYLKINDTKISYNDGAAATTSPVWKQWNIDLAATNVNLKSVKSLTLGVGGSGAGLLFVDDIRLYAVAPEVITPADPGAGQLVALYAMDGNVQDSSGKNYHGTLNGDAGYEAGYSGQALIFNGINAYVDLPIGSMIASLTDATVATHVYFDGGTGSWQRVFDFGTGTTTYMFLSPRQAAAGSIRFAIRTATVAEQIVDSPAAMPVGWHHVAVTIDSAGMRMKLYLDGEQVGEAATTLLPKDLGNTTQNWLGRSQWEADAYLSGKLDEFRIYNRALSASEVRYLAGDR